MGDTLFEYNHTGQLIKVTDAISVTTYTMGSVCTLAVEG